MLAVPAVGAVAQTLGKGGPQSQSWAQLHAQALVVVGDGGGVVLLPEGESQ